MSESGYAFWRTATTHEMAAARLAPLARLLMFLLVTERAKGSGLFVAYPDELTYFLVETSGASPDEVRAALAELEARGMLRREAHVVCLVGHLGRGSSARLASEKTRRGLQRYLAKLPRLAIVADAVRACPELVPPGERESSGLAWVFLESDPPSHPPSDTGIGNRIDTGIHTPTDTNSYELVARSEERGARSEEKPPASRKGRATWLTPFAEAWEGQYGGKMPVGPSTRPLGAAVKALGADEALRRWEIYLAQTEAQYANAARFASTLGAWTVPAAPHANDGTAGESTSYRRARVLLALAREYDLLSYNGNRDEYAARVERASADPRAGPTIADELQRVHFSRGLGEHRSEHFALLEVARRLDTAPQGAGDAIDTLHAEWMRRRGVVDRATFRRAVAPLFPASGPMFTTQQLMGAIDHFAELAEQDRPAFQDRWTLARFLADVQTYVRRGAMEYVDEWGVPTERGKLTVFAEAGAA